MEEEGRKERKYHFFFPSFACCSMLTSLLCLFTTRERERERERGFQLLRLPPPLTKREEKYKKLLMESARKNKREEREMFTHLKPLIVSTIR